MSTSIPKPKPTDYPAYFETYLKRLPDTDIIDLLQTQCEELINLVSELPETETEKGYAEGKWSLKELLQHMLDTERILGYRALCFARTEEVMLPGFDENKYAAASDANRRKLANILEEYRVVRNSTILLFKSFSPEMLIQPGNANNASYKTGALAWIIAAHENHHVEVIQTRYLKQEIES